VLNHVQKIIHISGTGQKCSKKKCVTTKGVTIKRVDCTKRAKNYVPICAHYITGTCGRSGPFPNITQTHTTSTSHHLSKQDLECPVADSDQPEQGVAALHQGPSGAVVLVVELEEASSDYVAHRESLQMEQNRSMDLPLFLIKNENFCSRNKQSCSFLQKLNSESFSCSGIFLPQFLKTRQMDYC
jgi:hypothetical protein